MMPVRYMNKRSPYESPRVKTHLKVNKNRLFSNAKVSACCSEASSISLGKSSSQEFLCNDKGETSSESDIDISSKPVNTMKSPRLLSLGLERLEKIKPWDHVGQDDVHLFTRSSTSASKAWSKERNGHRTQYQRPSTVPIVRADGNTVEIITMTKLQGGGQVKWKPSEKKRPHHPSSIQLPAVYETWKEPSRVNRRRTQAAAAAAAEARRSSRSVPTLSRRDKAESPERVSNSAPSSKPHPSNHDRQNSEGSSSLKKTNTPSRLPKINTLVTGAPESASTTSADSPLLKPKPSKPKDGGKKSTSVSSTMSTQKTNSSLSPSDGAPHSKVDRLKSEVEENNNVVTSAGKEVTQPKKLPSKHQNEKKDSVESVQRDGPSVRLKDTTALTERKKEEKHGKTASKSVINETISDGYQRTNATKEDFSLNVSDQSANVSNKLPKRTSERSIPEKKKENVNHKRLPESHADKTPPKFSDDRKANGTLTKSHSQSTISKQRLNDVESPTKVPPSRSTNSRVGTSISSRVNPRSKSDLVKVKPPMQRRRTKTGFFTSSGEFVTNDEDGKQSEVSAETSHTKRTDLTTKTARSHASGSTTSTNSSQMTTSQLVKKPLRRRPFIITKKTLARQKFYNSVYNNQHFKIQRQTAFLKKVENAQLRVDDEKTRESINSQKKKHESVVRQYQTLKRIRDKFDEEQVKRFSRQYVSWRSVEEDRLNRKSTVYGLPDNIYEDRYDKTLKEIPKVKKSKSKSNLKSNNKKFSRFARWVRNIRRFEQILKPNTGAGLEDSMLRSTRGALVEGRDIVELHQSRDDDANGAEGLIKTKKVVKVRNVIGSAKRLLQATQDMDAISEVSDEDDVDDDDYSDVSSLDLSDDE